MKMIKLVISADGKDEIKALEILLSKSLQIKRINKPKDKKNGKYRIYIRADLLDKLTALWQKRAD